MKVTTRIPPIKTISAGTGLVLVMAFMPLLLLVKGIYRVSNLVWQPASLQAVANEGETKEDSCVPYAKELPAIGFVPEHVSIPSNKTNLQVLAAPASYDYWEAQDSTAYFAVNSSPVTKYDGNVGIFAQDNDTAFSSIKSLKLQDTIEVSNKEFTAKYKVSELNITTSDATNMFAYTQEPTLTLIAINNSFTKKSAIIRASLVTITTNCYEQN